MLLLYNSVIQCQSLATLDQSEEEYSLIWKVKPLTSQTDKGK